MVTVLGKKINNRDETIISSVYQHNQPCSSIQEGPTLRFGLLCGCAGAGFQLGRSLVFPSRVCWRVSYLLD